VATPRAGQRFASVSGTWMVPDAYPPPSAWNGSGYENGVYSLLHWAGIGGVLGIEGDSLLQAGTATDVIVNGNVISVMCYAWFEWWNSTLDNGNVRLNGFTVVPGDTIQVSVCTRADASGNVVIGNVNTSEYMAQAIRPPVASLARARSSAGWIVEREATTDGSLATLADYGSMFLSDCLAGGRGFEADLSVAGLFSMVDGSDVISTAVNETGTVMQCYYGTNRP
jgi:hypothetical protein